MKARKYSMGLAGTGMASAVATAPAQISGMQNTTHGFMGGYGLWTIVGVLLVVFLVVAIVRMTQRK